MCMLPVALCVTANIHIHIIANRISLYGEVYDTTFVSNKAARVAMI